MLDQYPHQRRRPEWSPTRLQTGALCCLAVLLTDGHAVADSITERQALRVAVHVHSRASTGTMSLEALAERAEQLGVDAILLTENFALRYEYGLPPVRRLLRVGMSYPSLVEYGIERYLGEVAEVQARHPTVLLVPGIEAAPFSYWTGSPLTGDLTLHDTQKNLLTFGLAEPDHYGDLPAQGNPGSYRLTWESLVTAVFPVICVAGGVGMVLRFRHAVRQGHPRPIIAGRMLTATLLLVAGVTTAWTAWPLGQSPFPAYDSRLGYQPYQRFLDHVHARGGLAFWSMTEARDLSTHTFGPLGTVTVRTDPHPEALLLTKNYAGFGGLYQEAHHAIDAGGIWDRLIDLYLHGGRDDPPVMLGEIAFHGPEHAKKDLDQVLSVVSVRTRTAAGLLEAIRAGRLYAVERQKKEFALRLESFQLQCALGRGTAQMGESLEPGACGPVTLSARVSASDGQAHPIIVTIVRAGEVMTRVSGSTPLAVQVPDSFPSPDYLTAYRLIVEGGGELLTNPIFVRPTARAAGAVPQNAMGIRS